MNNNLVTYIADYYTGGYRELCHAVKERNERAIIEAAKLLATITPANAVIVPIPNHEGYATYTKHIALEISKINGCKVLDLLFSDKRDTLYNSKLKGSKIALNFQTKSTTPNGNIILIDNVIDTATTYNAACNAMKKQLPLITIAATQTFIRTLQTCYNFTMFHPSNLKQQSNERQTNQIWEIQRTTY